MAGELGAWLFARRGWLPVPVLLATLVLPPAHVGAGAAVMALGEGIRLWAVGHIGLPSRTRDASVGALVDTGPYAVVRNPLYVGNILLWTGLGVMCWPAALVVFPAFLLYYDLIVRWEEGRLRATHAEAFAAYSSRVGRWLPRRLPRELGGWDVQRALRTERGTFVVIAVVLALVAVRRAVG